LFSVDASSTIESDGDSDSELDEDIPPGVHSKPAGVEALGAVRLLAECPDTQPDSTEQCAWEGRTVASESTLHICVGASRTWKSVLYFIYTDHISFATLRSQGSKSRLDEISCDRRGSTIPPCSPKSLYSIAEMLGLRMLKQLAHIDIVSKIGKDNIVEETFSTFSSVHPTILTAATEILSQHCGPSTTIPARLSDKIRATLGRDSHHSEALKSVFGMLISKRRPVELRRTPCPFRGYKSHRCRDACTSCKGMERYCTSCSYTVNYESKLKAPEFCDGCDSLIKYEFA